MTATCTLCGAILKVMPDVRGQQFTFGELGQQFNQHLSGAHPSEPQTCILDAGYPPNFPIVRMIQTMGIVAQSAIMLSYLSSDDEQFNGMLKTIRDTLAAAVAQKEPRPVITQ